MNRLSPFLSATVPLAALFVLSACRGGPTPTPPSPDNAVLLRMAPPVGQVTRYRTAMETTTEMAGMPMASGPITMSQIMYQTNTVLEADGDVRRISSVIDDVQMAASGMPGMMGQEDRMTEMMEGLAMEFVMTTRGKTLSVEMPDSSPAVEMLQGLGMQDLMSGSSPIGAPLEFPEEAEKPGSTWTVPMEKRFAMGGLFQMEQRLDITYRFESLEVRNGVRYAILSFGGPMETAMVPDSTAPIAMDMTLQGEMLGNLEVDLDAGRAGRSTVTTSVSGLMTMMGREVNMAMTMNMETTPLPVVRDPSRIVFQSNRKGTWDLFSMNLDGSDLINLTESPSQERFPACSPDGSKIAFYSDRDGNREIYTMKVDGSGHARLTDDPERDEIPAWSPDGSRIAFQTTRDGEWEVYVMDADGSNQTNLSNHRLADNRPAWSPDGTKIVFQTYRDGNAEIYTMNADGSEQTRLTRSPAYDGSPAWSHDGTRITFSSGRDGNLEIYVMDADGSNQIRLTENGVVDEYSSWSADGSSIVFRSERDGNGEIYLMSSDGSNPVRLTNHPANDFGPGWCLLAGDDPEGIRQ